MYKMSNAGYKSLSYQECNAYCKEILSSIDISSQHWVVFDLDQTLLTDEKYRSTYQSYADTFKQQWKGVHDPIPEIVDLYNWCVKQGLSTCIITARTEKMRKITLSNLIRVGIRKCDRLYMKSGKRDKIQYKSQCRKEILESGGIILLNIGDQESDLLLPDGTYGYSSHCIKLPSTY